MRAERIAILRFENMSADPSLDWQGRALSEVLTQEIGAIPSTRMHSFDRVLGTLLLVALPVVLFVLPWKRFAAGLQARSDGNRSVVDRLEGHRTTRDPENYEKACVTVELRGKLMKAWTYVGLQEAIDRCEHVANLIESIVIKYA